VIEFWKTPENSRVSEERFRKASYSSAAWNGKTLLARAVAGEAGVTFFPHRGPSS